MATGFLLVSVVISLNGATGVLYHAPFPVLARAGWGFWGSYGMDVIVIVIVIIIVVGRGGGMDKEAVGMGGGKKKRMC